MLLLVYQGTDFAWNSLQRNILNFHIHTKFSVVGWTIQMGKVGHITLEPFTTNIAVEDFSGFLFLIGLDLTNVLFDIESFLSCDQHAFVPTSVDDWIVVIFFLLWTGKSHFLKFVLFPSKTVDFCPDTVNDFAVVILGHSYF